MKKLLENLKKEDAAKEEARKKETKYHFKTNLITAGNQIKEISVLTDQTNNKSVSKVFTYWSDNTIKVPLMSIIYNPCSLCVDDALCLLAVFDIAQKYHQRSAYVQTGKESLAYSGECTITFPPQVKPEELG